MQRISIQILGPVEVLKSVCSVLWCIARRWLSLLNFKADCAVHHIVTTTLKGLSDIEYLLNYGPCSYVGRCEALKIESKELSCGAVYHSYVHWLLSSAKIMIS